MNYNRRLFFFIVLLILAFSTSSLAFNSSNGIISKTTVDNRPNVLLIVADDLGYTDLGAYGGDIRTPNIDALAAEGILFTQFHTSPVCAPTRAMLLTGNNNHVAGVGRQGARGPVQVHLPGYETYLSNRVAPMPILLREAGYHTYSVGKWHLGTTAEQGPQVAGFERSFNLMHGGATYFSSSSFFEGGASYQADGEEVDYPEGRYNTELFTDRLMEFIDGQPDDGRPFFAYAAYFSPHWPLQVPDDYLNLYRGQYDAGYDVLREERFQSVKSAGLISSSSMLPPRNQSLVPWEELTLEQQRREARKMELYAAMVENLDYHIGRLVDYLKAKDLYDNTLIVFMSDNGAAAEDFYNSGYASSYLRQHYDNSYDNMGKSNSWVSYGRGWAEAGSAPFSKYKQYMREGGLVSPLIVAGPGVNTNGTINSSYLTVMDIAPTFLELGEAQYPTDGSVRPILGKSIVPILTDLAATVHDENYVTTLYHWGRAFIRQGKWKLVTLEPPFDESKFQLFDLEADPGETTNLAEVEPEQLEKMVNLWRTERRKLGIVLPRDL